MADSIVFTTYQPPGVYTQSIYSNENVTLVGGTRIPLVVGMASPILENVNVPIRRGSGRNFPVFQERDDLTFQVDGIATVFQVRNSPIVNPSTFSVSNNPEDVIVIVDGQSITATAVVGENAQGYGSFTLPFAPEVGSTLYVSYYYIRKDVSVTLEDLSSQVDGSTSEFFLFHRRVVDSSGLGNVTTDASQIRVVVNGVTQTVKSLNGEQGSFILNSVPALGSILKVSYKYTDLIDMNDPLPNKYVHSISRIGNVPSRSDYVNGVDYNFSHEETVNQNTFHEISWGNSFAITSWEESSTSFRTDWISGENAHVSLFDYPIVGEVAVPVDLIGGFTKVFSVSNTIVRGDGKGKPLYDPNIGSDIFDVYFGTTSHEALPGGASVNGNKLVSGSLVKVSKLDGELGRIYLDTAVNPSTISVYVVYRTNKMADEKYTITKVTETNGILPSTYKVSGSSFGYLPKISEGTHSLTLPLPSGTLLGEHLYGSQFINVPNFSDIYINRFFSQSETVRATITSVSGSSYKFEVTSTLTGTATAGLIGSNNSVNPRFISTLRSGIKYNEGYTGETFTDIVSGLTFNFRLPAGMLVGDYVEFVVTPEGEFDFFSSDIPSLPNYNNIFPGVLFLAEESSSISSVPLSGSFDLRTYNSAGSEPSEGDTYYVTYKYYRLDYSVRLYRRLSDIERDFGKANLSNPLSLAGKLVLENGAPVVALKPLRLYDDVSFPTYIKNGGFESIMDPSAEAELYKDSIKELENPFADNRTPYTLSVLTDDSSVWSFLKDHLEKMSSPFFGSNRYSCFGFNSNRNDSFVRARLDGFKSNRTLVCYPTSAIMNLEISEGMFSRVRVPGWFYAVAVSGLICKANILPSEPLTNKSVQGFVETGSYKSNDVLNDLAGMYGITILETKSPDVVIRDALNTDMTNILTREPTVTFIDDFIQNRSKIVLTRFIGRPFINNILGEVQTVFSAFMSSLRSSSLITDYKNLEVVQNPDDPTIVEISVQYAPVLPVKYITVTFRIRGTLG